MKNRIFEYLSPPREPKTPGHSDAESSLPKVDLQNWIKPAEEFIGEHPGACLAAALVVGVALAWWIKRR